MRLCVGNELSIRDAGRVPLQEMLGEKVIREVALPAEPTQIQQLASNDNGSECKLRPHAGKHLEGGTIDPLAEPGHLGEMQLVLIPELSPDRADRHPKHFWISNHEKPDDEQAPRLSHIPTFILIDKAESLGLADRHGAYWLGRERVEALTIQQFSRG